MANYVKKIINAGGMTESQSNKILELARNKSWELEPRQNYRERSAMLINDMGRDTGDPWRIRFIP